MRQYQFGLRDLLVFALLASLILAWRVDHSRMENALIRQRRELQREQSRERQAIAALVRRVEAQEKSTRVVAGEFATWRQRRPAEAVVFNRLKALEDPKFGAVPTSQENYLQVRDPNKVYVKQSEPHWSNPDRLPFRIYLPANRFFRLRTTAGEVRGYEESLFGRFPVFITLHQNAIDIRVRDETSRVSLAEPLAERIATLAANEQGNYELRGLSASEPVVLFNLADDAAEIVFSVWLEPL